MIMVEISCLDCDHALDMEKDHIVRIVVNEDRSEGYAHEGCISLVDASCEKHGEFFQTKKGIGVCPSC